MAPIVNYLRYLYTPLSLYLAIAILILSFTALYQVLRLYGPTRNSVDNLKYIFLIYLLLYIDAIYIIIYDTLYKYINEGVNFFLLKGAIYYGVDFNRSIIIDIY